MVLTIHNDWKMRPFCVWLYEMYDFWKKMHLVGP